MAPVTISICCKARSSPPTSVQNDLSLGNISEFWLHLSAKCVQLTSALGAEL